MAIVGFHFSGVYGEKLRSKRKCASVMPGTHVYGIGSHIFVYLAEGNVMEPDAREERIGSGTIQTTRICPLGELTLEEAVNCGYESAESLKSEMKQWFPEMKDESPVTYVKFDMELY